MKYSFYFIYVEVGLIRKKLYVYFKKFLEINNLRKLFFLNLNDFIVYVI